MLKNKNDDNKRISYTLGQDLDELSVEEIEDTTTLLKDEIKRLDTAKTAKSKHLSAAEALFNKK